MREGDDRGGGEKEGGRMRGDEGGGAVTDTMAPLQWDEPRKK